MKRFSLLTAFLLTATISIRAQQTAGDGGVTANRPGAVSLGIVVDNSGSYRTIFERVINSANSVINDLRDGDEAFLVTFVDTPKIALRQEFTANKSDLRDAVENMFVEGGQTAVLDAVMFAARYLSDQANRASGNSRVIVLITDGDERQSDATTEQVVAALKAAKIRVFVLGLYDERFYTKVIDRLVRETGGAKFVPKLPRDTPASVNSLLVSIREK